MVWNPLILSVSRPSAWRYDAPSKMTGKEIIVALHGAGFEVIRIKEVIIFSSILTVALPSSLFIRTK